MNNADLLRPSLSGHNALPRLLSIRSMFVVAVFGGIVAILPYSLLNMYRLERLRRDWWVPAIGVVASLILIALFFSLDLYESKRILNLASSTFGLLYAALFYWKYLAIFRSITIYEQRPASPFIPGLLCLAFGLIMIFLILMIRL